MKRYEIVLSYQKSGYERETVIQAELYLACKKAKLFIDLEYSILAKEIKGRRAQVESRFDLVVVQNYEIIAIVEVKDYNSFGCSVNKDQIHKYKQYGVPVFVLYSKYDIPHLIKKLLVVRKGFLKKVDEEQIKYFAADKKSEELKEAKLDLVFNLFNETYPDYKYMEKYSLELLAIAVEKLGFEEVVKVLYRCSTVDSLMNDLKSYIAWTERRRSINSLFTTFSSDHKDKSAK